MLHLHCTAGLGKTLNVTLMPAPNESDLDWLDCWYARHIPLDLPLDALLFTNAATNYSLVHPFGRRERPEEVVVTFQQRLAWVLGQPVPTRPKSYSLCKTSSRRVLGCMNEQTENLLYLVDRQLTEDGVQFEVIEGHLNAGISGGLFPRTEFEKRIGQNSHTNLKSTKSPFMKIVDN
jgi:hypothetical protein